MRHSRRPQILLRIAGVMLGCDSQKDFKYGRVGQRETNWFAPSPWEFDSPRVHPEACGSIQLKSDAALPRGPLAIDGSPDPR